MLLVGGGARSEAVRQIAPAMFGVPVSVPEPGEYVALGAARQAGVDTGQAPTLPPSGRSGAVAEYDAAPAPAGASGTARSAS